MAPNQNGSTRCFNPAATIHVESRKPTRFIFSAICKLFCDTHQVHQAYLFYGHTKLNKIVLPVVHIKPTGNNESMQKFIQMDGDRLYAWN